MTLFNLGHLHISNFDVVNRVTSKKGTTNNTHTHMFTTAAAAAAAILVNIFQVLHTHSYLIVIVQWQ